MNPDWRHTLTRLGAFIESDTVQHFGDKAAELCATAKDTVLADLSQFGRLRVSGADAQSFLQNLLSNDIREVGSTSAQHSSFNTPKGRMLANMLIWREGDDYLLQLPHVLCEPIRKKLAIYILRAKVTITDASDDFVSLGLSGEKSQELLHAHFGELPHSPLGVLNTEHGSSIYLGDTRLQINASAQHAMEIWAAFSRHAKPVGSICWDWLSIRSGIPVILPSTQEQFVAQMVNFELIGGVNFNKGCYPGQEIVARMQYLGKLKRRMYLAHLDYPVYPEGHKPPQAGDELYSADMGDQASGMIVNAAPAPGGGYDLLASVQISSKETQKVLWKSLQGLELMFMPLPYPLPEN